MKVVNKAASQVQWVFLDRPGEVLEQSFNGSVEEATAFLEGQASCGKFFGHILRDDGLILANVARMDDTTAKVSLPVS